MGIVKGILEKMSPEQYNEAHERCSREANSFPDSDQANQVYNDCMANEAADSGIDYDPAPDSDPDPYAGADPVLSPDQDPDDEGMLVDPDDA